ncbi:hypothetical protein PGT21_034136 [Puccinia graminis f. sp. tritici]|uniref:Uncharacterized protein n=1 Tax=Puccinia graminis f. sp. tritici TaxID=56615 RepID=A0A5B0MQI0_PUCGR|nr:hypothetical protein PGT21_034136 [Puccinia graminis f. sp. tritici]
MRASASHRIVLLSHRIRVSDAGPRIASSASEKTMRRIGIASISQCDARYFAGDADVIGRHRLSLPPESPDMRRDSGGVVQSSIKSKPPIAIQSSRLQRYRSIVDRNLTLVGPSPINRSLSLVIYRHRSRSYTATDRSSIVVGSSEHPKRSKEALHRYTPIITSLHLLPPTHFASQP